MERSGGIVVYNRYIPPEDVVTVERAVLRDLKNSLKREGDIRGRQAIEEIAYRWMEERITRY